MNQMTLRAHRLLQLSCVLREITEYHLRVFAGFSEALVPPSRRPVVKCIGRLQVQVRRKYSFSATMLNALDCAWA